MGLLCQYTSMRTECSQLVSSSQSCDNPSPMFSLHVNGMERNIAGWCPGNEGSDVILVTFVFIIPEHRAVACN